MDPEIEASIAEAERQGALEADSMLQAQIQSAVRNTTNENAVHIDIPGPILPATIATSLQRSAGYECKGQLPLEAVAATSAVVTDEAEDPLGFLDEDLEHHERREQPQHRPQQQQFVNIKSVKQLIECHSKEQVALPSWAVGLLKEVHKSAGDEEPW